MSGEHTLKAVHEAVLLMSPVRSITRKRLPLRCGLLRDGLLLIKQGKVEWFWRMGKRKASNSDTIRVRDYRGKLIVPGFVDTHIHYPQK